jgi:hypothetical protein
MATDEREEVLGRHDERADDLFGDDCGRALSFAGAHGRPFADEVAVAAPGDDALAVRCLDGHLGPPGLDQEDMIGGRALPAQLLAGQEGALGGRGLQCLPLGGGEQRPEGRRLGAVLLRLGGRRREPKGEPWGGRLDRDGGARGAGDAGADGLRPEQVRHPRNRQCRRRRRRRRGADGQLPCRAPREERRDDPAERRRVVVDQIEHIPDVRGDLCSLLGQPSLVAREAQDRNGVHQAQHQHDQAGEQKSRDAGDGATGAKELECAGRQSHRLHRRDLGIT